MIMKKETMIMIISIIVTKSYEHLVAKCSLKKVGSKNIRYNEDARGASLKYLMPKVINIARLSFSTSYNFVLFLYSNFKPANR